MYHSPAVAYTHLLLFIFLNLLLPTFSCGQVPGGCICCAMGVAFQVTFNKLMCEALRNITLRKRNYHV